MLRTGTGSGGISKPVCDGTIEVVRGLSETTWSLNSQDKRAKTMLVTVFRRLEATSGKPRHCYRFGACRGNCLLRTISNGILQRMMIKELENNYEKPATIRAMYRPCTR